jgi:hypothetical protein
VCSGRSLPTIKRKVESPFSRLKSGCDDDSPVDAHRRFGETYNFNIRVQDARVFDTSANIYKATCNHIHKTAFFIVTNVETSDSEVGLFILQSNVSETGFCLRLQVKHTQLCPIDELFPISGHLYQHQDGVYKPSIAQTICES